MRPAHFAVLVTALASASAFAQVYRQDRRGGSVTLTDKPAVTKARAYAARNDFGPSLLWPKMQFGMTLAQVLRLAPGSKRVEYQDSRYPPSVKLEGFVFAGKTFVVQFSFRADRLTQVHLSDPVFREDNQAIMRTFESIVAELRQAYGPESTNRIDRRWSGMSGEAEWRRDAGRINVSISPVTKDFSMILFNFFEK